MVKMLTKLIFLVILAAFASAQDLPVNPPEPRLVDSDTNVKINYRLPNETYPLKYDVWLMTRIDEGNFTFNGRVKITIRAEKDTKEVKIHQRQLKIEIIYVNNSPINADGWSYDNVTEFLTIRSNFAANQTYILDITYTGELRADNAGFYRSSYIDKNGNKKWLATTQFESTDARHAFPCYDEPKFKATFAIKIQHGPKYRAISNMPEKREENFDHTVTTSFAETKKTSSYLIAFVVSDFEYKSAQSTKGFLHRVFSAPPLVETAQFAATKGEQVLSALEQYLKVDFSLPKMDQVALADFNAGAMENWGLVTYREQYLLFNESQHSHNAKSRIVTIISHEFAHQWFGNLVSPKWWNFVWLNEGFATLFEHIGTNLVHPEWDIFERFLIEKFQSVMKTDSEKSTRPMTYYAESPKEIQKSFDTIAYAKSGSVLRTFMHALGENTFKKGLEYYLNNNSYDAVTEFELFKHLDAAAHEDNAVEKSLNVSSLFLTWSHQKGYPLVTANRSDDAVIHLSQKRYLSSKNDSDEIQSTWWIPFNIATASNAEFNDTKADGWLPPQQDKFNTKYKTNKNEWYLLNKQATGYYRVLYDTENYKLITNELVNGSASKIHHFSRSQLIDDLLAFIKADQVAPKVFFDLLKYLHRETEYAPLETSRQALEYLRGVLQTSHQRNAFYAFVQKQVKQLYEKTNVTQANNEKVRQNKIRETVVRLACAFEDPKCLKETNAALKRALESDSFSSPNIRGTIYLNGGRTADLDDIKKLWNRLDRVTDLEERAELIAALTNSHNQAVLGAQLKKVTDAAGTPLLTKSERQNIIARIAINVHAGDLVIDYLSENVENAMEVVSSISGLLEVIANNYIGDDGTKRKFELLVRKVQASNKIAPDAANRLIALAQGRSEAFSIQSRVELYFRDAEKESKGASTVIVPSMVLMVATAIGALYI